MAENEKNPELKVVAMLKSLHELSEKKTLIIELQEQLLDEMEKQLSRNKHRYFGVGFLTAAIACSLLTILVNCF